MREVRPRERALACPGAGLNGATPPFPPVVKGDRAAVEGSREKGSLEAKKTVVFGREAWKGP